MRTALVITGVVLFALAAGGYLYVTSAASDCHTRPGQVGQALDPDIEGQCRLAATLVNAALFVGIGGVIVAAVGVLT